MLIVHKPKGNIVLPVSLCNSASLPEDFTRDARKMRELSEYKISHPDQRFNRISDFMLKLQKNEEFKQWGL